MQTNDLKKGTMIHLRNGWQAMLQDNKKGNSRLCTVYGHFTEMGSCYAWDFLSYLDNEGNWNDIELTEKQIKQRSAVRSMGF